ncbi:purine-nucleoside phosphorylase [Austwickia chelonae]|uniref:Purine nucleoside phosphorylase DeoD-type n=1 Tax=Austwickia chelonae NBRC 105200 TaxID=1184607 RepID=K6V4T1_9MICO|nr:purine-nucleoside phosphorylase [Austwickia chelonae]GAB77173.1 purine nucleoside phosphorylase DeoD-type [Austwickia chelonae NBRC 105200]SEW04452.1 purine-nucleoside phosphorylase [Austwickia chelonae]
MATPHISAEPGSFASAVLMPGDPRRARRIAEQLMPDAELITDVRGMLGFTGTIDGKPLSVMGSGMGMPSATIYATELFMHYGVERIIRVGTAGGISRRVSVGDVIVATGAHTDSSINQHRLPGLNFSATASFPLAAAAMGAAAGREGVHVGTVLSKDHFYLVTPFADLDLYDRYGILGAEMEAAALFGVAAEFGKDALAVLTVSDHLLDGSSDMSAEERETRFGDALALAVAAAHS